MKIAYNTIFVHETWMLTFFFAFKNQNILIQ